MQKRGAILVMSGGQRGCSRALGASQARSRRRQGRGGAMGSADTATRLASPLFEQMVRSGQRTPVKLSPVSVPASFRGASGIQLAWLWLRHQPGSALSDWFRGRVGTLQGRTPDRHRCHGEKAFDRTLSLYRDGRVARWRRAEDDGRSDGLANTNRRRRHHSPTTLREPRPSSSLVVFNYRVSGGSRSPGQRLVYEALWCGRPRRARPHVRLRSICCDAGLPGTRETVALKASSEDRMQTPIDSRTLM